MPSFRLTRSSNRQPAFIEQQPKQESAAAGSPSTASVSATALVGVEDTDGSSQPLPSATNANAKANSDANTNTSNANPLSALSAAASQSQSQSQSLGPGPGPGPGPVAAVPGPQQSLASASDSSSFDSRRGPLPPPAAQQQAQGLGGVPAAQGQSQQQQLYRQQQIESRGESESQLEYQSFAQRAHAKDAASKRALHLRSFSSLDNRRDYTELADTDAPAGHTQSHRYSAFFAPEFSPSQHPHAHSPEQQPQQLLHQQQSQRQHFPSQGYHFASGSVDSLHRAASHQQQVVSPGAPAPPPAQEKRSARKLIKDILLGSSSRSAHDHTHHNHQHHQHQHQQQPHHGGRNDNGPSQPPHAHRPNVIRKTPKGAGAPPAVTTNFSHPTSKPTSPQDWPRESQGSHNGQQATPPPQRITEVDDHYRYEHNPNRQSRHLDSDLILGDTIRRVSSDTDASPYEDAFYHQQQEPPHQVPHPAPSRQTQHTPGDAHPQPALLPEAQHQDLAGQRLLIDEDDYDYEQDRDQNHLLHHTLSVPTPRHSRLDPDRYSVTTASDIVVSDPRQHSSESISQFSHESPSIDSDQRSTNQPSPLAGNTATQSQDIARAASPVGPEPHTQQAQQFVMAPPGGGPPNQRRTQPQTQAQSQAQAQEAERLLRGGLEPPLGPPPGYRNNGAAMNTAAMSPLPTAPNQGGVGTSQVPAFRSERTMEGSNGEPSGRTDSPQPSNPDQSANEGEKAFKDLLTKYKNVKRLYFDGKSQIEGLTGQVEQLQNAVANQRMSQSRTALDDNEYATRFNRLNGAINNLSFNIRKDWRTVPQWLEKFVSADALKTGKQEMTAVGRAVITRWLVEEVFNKCFHPGLEPNLSAQLKEIELSIRGNAYNMQSQEEYDALTTRIVNWRMTTLDGLQRRLNSPSTGDNRLMLTNKETRNLTTLLHQYLTDPPPVGVEGSTSMIVELAVGIAANLPLESRDVAIMYPLPGDPVQPHLMEIEKMGLPTLEAHRVDADLDVDDDLEKERAKVRTDKAKANTLAALGGPAVRKGSVGNTGDLEGLPKDTSIVRFAGFMALEVRGRQVLMKAPVWTL